MKYKILQLVPTGDAITVVAQPHTERGAVARGVEDFLVRPGLDEAAQLRGAERGELWEIEADEQGKVTKAERREERTA
jgi:hypothetical protein